MLKWIALAARLEMTNAPDKVHPPAPGAPDSKWRSFIAPALAIASVASLLMLNYINAAMALPGVFEHSQWAALATTAILATALSAVGLAAGAVFGLAQQLRGAHFLSHDIASLAVCWAVACCVDRLGDRRGPGSGGEMGT